MESFLLDIQEYYTSKYNVQFKSDVSSYIITKPMYLVLIKKDTASKKPENRFIKKTTKTTKFALILLDQIEEVDYEDPELTRTVLFYGFWVSAAKMVFDASREISLIYDFEHAAQNIIGFYSKTSNTLEGQFNLSGYKDGFFN